MPVVPGSGHFPWHPVLLLARLMLWSEVSQVNVSHWNLLVMLRAGKSVNNLITSASYPNGCSSLESPFVSSLLKKIRGYIDFFFFNSDCIVD